MPEFLKNLIAHDSKIVVRAPTGKRNVVGTVKLSHGKGFSTVREDILQKGISRQRSTEAA
jgi:hypothetical protein